MQYQRTSREIESHVMEVVQRHYSAMESTLDEVTRKLSKSESFKESLDAVTKNITEINRTVENAMRQVDAMRDETKVNNIRLNEEVKSTAKVVERISETVDKEYAQVLSEMEDDLLRVIKT